MAINNRTYKNLYLGANEDSGKDKITLSYSVSSKEVILYTDYNNIFRYPEYALSIPLSASSFVKDGAVAGQYPNITDRITYAGHCIPYGKNTMLDNFGVYLTTWLYKESMASNISAVWMDRWYNPQYISEIDALNEPYSTNHPAIKDSPTRMVLENNIIYNYYHYGNYTNFNSISSDDLKIHFEDWTIEEANKYETLFVNSSSISNLNIIVNRDIPVIEKPIKPVTNIEDNIIRINNKVAKDYILDITAPQSYVNIPYSNVLTNNDISVSCWMKTDNWKNSNTRALISNGFRSGWNLRLNNGFYNPLIVMVTNVRNDGKFNVLVYNVEGKLVNVYEIITYVGSTIISYTTDNSLYSYIYLKNGYPGPDRSVLKIDLLNGQITDEVINPSVGWPGPYIRKIDLDKNNDIIYLLPTQKYNLNNQLSVSMGGITNDMFDIDNFNNMWRTYNGAIQRKKDGESDWNMSKYVNIFPNANAVKLKCAFDDTLWVISSAANSKYNIDIYNIKDTDHILEYPTLTFIHELLHTNIIPINNTNQIIFDMVNINNTTIGIVVDFSTNNMFKIDSTGKVFGKEKIYNPKGDTFVINRHLSTYDWNRKFNYIKNNRNSVIELETYTTGTTGNIIKNTITYNTSGNLTDNEWHHFAFTVNQNNATLYVDTVSTGYIDLSGNPLYFIYETPLLIGTSVERIRELPIAIKNEKYDYFTGYIDDFRLYHNTLKQSDLECIYTNKFRYKDLIFNMPLKTDLYCIEEIDRFFKFKLPGAKSPYYNIKISGIKGLNDDLKLTIETIIRNSVKYIAPAYTELFKITWVE
jgi:hypothetical protein